MQRSKKRDMGDLAGNTAYILWWISGGNLCLEHQQLLPVYYTPTPVNVLISKTPPSILLFKTSFGIDRI
jgi:hypothetical protein